jgi:membrane-associated protein
VLALLVGGESMGIPLPGETALIVGAVAAHRGDLHIEIVILVAAAAAIVGDNIGYLIGRKFGRRLMTRPGRRQAERVKALERGEVFFAKHGPKAVFLGRWVAALRIWAAWIAGMTHMPWRTFLFWNALGGIGWAVCFGLVGYFAGEAAAKVIAKVGVGAAVVIGAAAVIAFVVVKRRRRSDEAT